MTQELRTLYVDSAWCDRDAVGGLALPLPDQIEVPGQDLVAFVADFTISGSFTTVNDTMNKLYVIERTPTNLQYEDPYVLCKKSASDNGTVEAVALITGSKDAQYSQFEYKMELTIPGQGGTANATVLLYRNDDTCQLAGTIFYGAVDTTSSATPPSNDLVQMDFEYSTGIGTWTAKFPYKTTEWGWYQYTNIKGVQGAASDTYQEKLRVLTIPSMDYTSATLRPVLQQLLNEEPFLGLSLIHI